MRVCVNMLWLACREKRFKLRWTSRVLDACEQHINGKYASRIENRKSRAYYRMHFYWE